jgi:selenocysteine lyase/cysteine desulfurase
LSVFQPHQETPLQPLPPHTAPDDEARWALVRDQYEPSPDFINLDNGYIGMPAHPVRAAMRRYQDEMDRETSYFLRMRFPERLERVIRRLATFTGVAREELLITRNAMESFNILVQGYPFREGDEVLLARHDYDSAIETLAMVAARKSLALVQVDVPLDPIDDDAIVDLYRAALTPRTRVLLVTHVVHRTGQIMPVARIAAMAKARGVDVIVDGAHALAHLDVKLADLGVPFASFNLHKWVGAPLGVGLLYVARERIADIAALYGDTSHAPGDVKRLGHFGTVPPAPILAIEDALDFHDAIGGANKEGRLRYLARYWQDRVRDLPGVRLYTPTDPRRHGALAAFGIAGMAAADVSERLMREHRLFTVVRSIGDDACVRVTPHLYTTTADLDVLVGAIRMLADEVVGMTP